MGDLVDLRERRNWKCSEREVLMGEEVSIEETKCLRVASSAGKVSKEEALEVEVEVVEVEVVVVVVAVVVVLLALRKREVRFLALEAGIWD